MAVTIDAGARRPVIIYIIVAIVLFASLLLGVRWVKNRTAYYDQSQVGQSQPADNKEAEQVSQPPAEHEQAMAPAPQPQSQGSHEEHEEKEEKKEAPEEHPAPAQVPSTGPEQIVLTLLSLSALAFAGTGYLRARHRLFTIR